MSDITTIARPYAKAIFEHALMHNQLKEWSGVLYELAEILLNKDVMRFIKNPVTTSEQHVELLSVLLNNFPLKLKDEEVVGNLLKLLASNKRLEALPDIFVQYEALRAEQEKTIAAKVTSFTELNNAEKEQLMDALSRKLQRQVTLEISIDKTLLGGAVIHAGDLVIDGSVRGKLNKLSAELAA